MTNAIESFRRMLNQILASSFARAIALMMLAILLFDLMGAIIKHLGQHYPPQQLSLFRNIFGTVPSLVALSLSRSWHESGRPIRIRQWKLALVRGLFITVAQFCFYLALARLEFATATTLMFSGPLLITLLSIPVHGHKVGFSRWLAVLVGFAGVMLVMRPGSEVFSWVALLPLGAAFCYACTSVTAKLFDDSVPTALINLFTVVGALAGSTTVVLVTGGYVRVGAVEDWLWLLGMGTAGGTAVFCLISAYRMTAPSNLSPFEYFGIPIAFTIGWFFFAEAPFGRLFPGVLLIIGGGLLIVWHELRKSQPSGP
ncbi:MAG: DMT family transporter [SAR324 cluster bacterium]|nr:DMT family transporter [SAR324 cluster bacterium]